MKIELVKVGELLTFLASERYLTAKNCPISPHRAHSQYHNPRANADDPALLLAIESNDIIGYIGFLPDRIQETTVYWNSGWWVAPHAHHAAIPLLLHFIKTGQERILLTDLTPQTEAIIRKLSFFNFLPVSSGLRGYMKLDLAHILPRISSTWRPIQPILKGSDWITNQLLSFGRSFQKYARAQDLTFERITKLNPEDAAFIARYSGTNLLGRQAEDLQWIHDYPWVVNTDLNNTTCNNYYFTTTASDFQVLFIRICKGKEIQGVVMMRLLHQKLMVPYCYAYATAIPALMHFLYQWMVDHHCIDFTTYHPTLKQWILQNKSPFLWKKDLNRIFAYHRSLDELITEPIALQDGDGDVAFC